VQKKEVRPSSNSNKGRISDKNVQRVQPLNGASPIKEQTKSKLISSFSEDVLASNPDSIILMGKNKDKQLTQRQLLAS